MKNLRLQFLILVLFSGQVTMSQQVQTIRTTETRIQVEKIADSSMVYLFPELVEARIILKDGRTTQAKINYNILLDIIEIQTRTGMNALETRSIKKVEIGETELIFREGEGFLEVLSEGRFPLLLKRQIRVSAMPVRRGAFGGTDHASSIDVLSTLSTTDGLRGQTIMLENPGGQEMEISLRYNESFAIFKGDQLVRLNNARQLQRDFPEYRNELRDFLRRENINFSNRFDLMKLLMFMNNLK